MNRLPLIVHYLWLGLVLSLCSSITLAQEQTSRPTVEPKSLGGDERGLELLVLGTAQDAGYPQAGCWKACCSPVWQDPSRGRFPTSIALLDHANKKRWLFDCTWQLPAQLQTLQVQLPREDSPGIDGIFLTHGHIGHYTGLMHLGREVMGSQNVPVYAMPRMTQFLKKNGPWSLLVELENIAIQQLAAGKAVKLTDRVQVTPIEVPHRGEFSETVGFLIKTDGQSVLYLPDIDKWSRWETKIEEVLRTVDLAFLDATFFQDGEIPGRNMSEIPHPFVEESLLRFQGLPASERAKIHFIHLNHTNPALDENSNAAQQIRRAGMHLAKQGEIYSLEKRTPNR
ncbi:MAG: MBL fold metallo-hydrolase [Planctomycetota bacterium]